MEFLIHDPHIDGADETEQTREECLPGCRRYPAHKAEDHEYTAQTHDDGAQAIRAVCVHVQQQDRRTEDTA